MRENNNITNFEEYMKKREEASESESFSEELFKQMLYEAYNVDDEESDEQYKFTVINEDGEAVECDILFTFDSEETGHSYIVYTDNTEDEFGGIKVYASIYDPTVESCELMPIETEQEWAVIENILAELQDAMSEQYGDFDDFEE